MITFGSFGVNGIRMEWEEESFRHFIMHVKQNKFEVFLFSIFVIFIVVNAVILNHSRRFINYIW